MIRKTAELCPTAFFPPARLRGLSHWGTFMREARRFRKGAVFADALANATPLDRNQQAKILYVADMLERRTKAPGKRNGCLGYIGLAVLRALLLRCMNRKTGLCCPSYTGLENITGLCRGSIGTALARLEASGIVKVVRRLVRKAITRISPITGHQQLVVTTLQGVNAYSFSSEPHPVPLPVAAAKLRPFPARRAGPPAQFAMSFEPSLPRREEHVPPVSKGPALTWREAARAMLAKGSAMK
jgi:hypothetical protein